jgi:hypothetical protein
MKSENVFKCHCLSQLLSSTNQRQSVSFTSSFGGHGILIIFEKYAQFHCILKVKAIYCYKGEMFFWANFAM